MAPSIVDSEAEYAAVKNVLSSELVANLADAVAALQARENLFAVLRRVLKDEGVHSDMLCWLLRPRPRGWHGLEQRFARKLVTAILAECGSNPDLPFEIEDVQREFSTGSGPIDLLVTLKPGAPVRAVGIENKIDSPESDRQLLRYAAGLEEWFGRGQFAIAYLTPKGRDAISRPDCLFATIGYGTVAALLNAAITESPLPPDGAIGLNLARQYLEALRVNIVKEPTEIDRLCRVFYDDHRAAWHALRRRLPSERDDLHATLGEAICKRFTRDHGGEWRFSVKHEEYARVYRPSWRRLGSGDDDPVLGLGESSKFYDAHYAAVHLRIGIEPFGDEADERFQYRIRGKVHTKQADARLRTAVRRALARVDGVKVPEHDDKHQFMIPAKSNSTLPSVDQSPDTVVDWVMKLDRFKHAVRELDSVFGKQ